MPPRRVDNARASMLRDARRNRRAWDADSEDYQRDHAKQFGGDKALAWGLWRVPERDLNVLGDVRRKDTLELGSGAASWSYALADRGARPVALDNSFNQLLGALKAQGKRRIALVQADGELLPFRDGCFDIVFSDYGAMSFADPLVTVPGVARVLKPGGLLAFMTTTPFLSVCWPDTEEQVTTTLHYPYFGLHRSVWTPDDTVDFQLPYGGWIRLFRNNGLAIEDLIEVQPPSRARTSFPGRPLSWARRWPAEMIWKVRKE